MFFGKTKKSDAAAKKQDEELDLAISARIAEVVRVAESTGADAATHIQSAAFHASHKDTPSSGASVSHQDVLGAISQVEALASHRGVDAGPGFVPVAELTGVISAIPAVAGSYAQHDDAPAFKPDVSYSEAGELTSIPSSPVAGGTAPDGNIGYQVAPAILDSVEMLPVRSGSIMRAQPQASSLATLDQLSPFVLTPDAIAVDQLLQETSRHLRNMGSVNILVAGQTGVGKSTLINSVFGEQFAKTAAGRPVTQRAEWYSSETVPLRILDTRGLEAKDYAITLHDMRMEIETLRAQRDERDQLHMAWVCISSPSSRVQDCEVDIIRVLNKYDIPAIIVLTKDDEDPEFAEVVSQVMDERRAVYASIVPVRALKKPNRPAMGLEQLVVATFTALPAAHRAAFAAAQKINRDLNKSAAEDYVTAATSAAAAAAVIPLPFADMVTLAPIQASMLVGISGSFGLTFERPQIMQLITTVLGCLALSLAGRWAVGTVLKFIPGPGSVLGAVLNAGVAGAMTQKLGNTYIRFLYSFIETNGRVPTADETIEVFPAFFRAKRND